MAPETLPSIWPFAVMASTGILVLLALGLSSARSRQVLVPLSPILVLASLFGFGFFWSANEVRSCTDCASTFTVAGLRFIGTQRVGTGVGGLLYADVAVLFGVAVTVGLLIAGRSMVLQRRTE